MSRTTRDLPDQCDEIERDEHHVRLDKGIFSVRRMTTRTFRYSANELRTAEEEGRRPVPKRIVRRLDWFYYTWGSRTVTNRREYLCNDRETNARMATRDALIAARNKYNTKSKNFEADILPLPRYDISMDLW